MQDSSAVSKVLVFGGTGQAKVVRPILEHLGYTLLAVYDGNPKVQTFPDIPMLHTTLELEEWISKQAAPLGFALAIGGSRGALRCELAKEFLIQGLHPVTLQHPSSWVAGSAHVGSGTQILAMAAVSEDARLGAYCIVNTNATVDHECRIGNGVHIMPGATLAGRVTVGDYATIGSNATILPRLSIGPRAIVGAGAVVVKNVSEGAVVKGNPAR